jgi:release factor glutamine methyltransferase
LHDVVVDGLTIIVTDQTYIPAEDTYLIMDNMEIENGEMVLDLGTGCGILAIVAARRAKKVVAIDINPYATACALMNVNLQNLKDKIDVRQGDLYNALNPKEKFDLILFNPPYLPEEMVLRNGWLSKAWASGPKGTEVTESFLSGVKYHLKKGGRLLFISSSLSCNDPLSNLKRLELSGIVKARKKLDFETLYLIEARPTH